MKPTSISQFIDHHYRHFNAAAMKHAAHAYTAHLDRGGAMLVTLAGAMSTAELGLSLAEMIRRDKVHAICCTGRIWKRICSIWWRRNITSGSRTIGN